jgi:hypothetical protein
MNVQNIPFRGFPAFSSYRLIVSLQHLQGLVGTHLYAHPAGHAFILVHSYSSFIIEFVGKHLAEGNARFAPGSAPAGKTP